MIYDKRIKEYEIYLAFQKKFFKKVINMSEKWNIRLKDEDEVPNHKLTIMKCEDGGAPGTNVFC